jgi:hypothetical protein
MTSTPASLARVRSRVHLRAAEPERDAAGREPIARDGEVPPAPRVEDGFADARAARVLQRREHAEPRELSHALRRDEFAAQLLAGEAFLFGEQHARPRGGQVNRRARARGPSADDDCVEVRHLKKGAESRNSTASRARVLIKMSLT